MQARRLRCGHTRTETGAAVNIFGGQRRLWCYTRLCCQSRGSFSLGALWQRAGMGVLFTLGAVVFLQESH